MKTDLQRIDTTRIPTQQPGAVLKSQSEPGCLDIIDVLHNASGEHTTSERWQRARYHLGKSIPPATDAPPRQASNKMERDGLLYCSGCKEYHPKEDFSRVKLSKRHQSSTGYSRTALEKRGYRYWCKSFESDRAAARYYGRLGDKALSIVG